MIVYATESRLQLRPCIIFHRSPREPKKNIHVSEIPLKKRSRTADDTLQRGMPHIEKNVNYRVSVINATLMEK